MDSQKKVYMLGIGGISMYALALFLKNCGRDVRGYDAKASETTTLLEANGIVVDYKISTNQIDINTEIVYTGAIKPDNAILMRAKELKLSIYTRAQILGYISRKYDNVIAIAGSHGKSTTTALIGEIFLAGNKNPSIHIGAFSKNLHQSYRIGSNEFFITEACEYENSFLMLKPDVSIITNIDKDHLDFFKNFENLENSFIKFILQSQVVVANDKCGFGEKANISFGDKKADYYLKKCKKIKNYMQKLIIYKNNQYFGRFILGVPYKHNAINALSAVAVADLYGIDKKTISSALMNFRGVKRRFEKIGKTKNGAEVFVDYAHHPNELFETIKGTKQLTKRKIVVVFQPHTYSRTKLLLDDFLKAFQHADDVVIFETFSAREKYCAGGSARTLHKLLCVNKPCRYFASKKLLANELINNTTNKHLILIMGAGDINGVADMLVQEKT